MANRTLQQKIIKMRRRNRYMRFTETKVMKTEDDPIVQFGKTLKIGPQSLSKQLIGIGLKGHDSRPAATGITRDQLKENIKPRQKWEEVPKSLGLSIGREQAEQLAVMLKDQKDLAFHHRIIDGRRIKVFCFYDSRMTDIFLVEIDYRLLTIRRSFNFSKISHAQDAAIAGTVMWKKPLPVLSSSTE